MSPRVKAALAVVIAIPVTIIAFFVIGATLLVALSIGIGLAAGGLAVAALDARRERKRIERR